MSYYLKPEAYKELNEQGWTDILDKDGENTGGSLMVHDGVTVCPCIYNMFGHMEEFPLKRVEIDEDGDVCCVTPNGDLFNLSIYKPDDTSNYCKIWEAKR